MRFRNRWMLLGFILCCPWWLFGQDDKELQPVTRSYAITNITVVHAPGRKTEGANVIIRDGLIVAAGKGVAVPSDAIVIKGDSMFVYAGFIDGFSRAGVTKPKEENRERVKDPSMPPPERAGVNPQVDVRPFLNPADKGLEELRNAGFTTTQVAPHGNMLAGQAAIILTGGSSGDGLVLANHTALYSDLSPANNVYPATILGVMAKWRELYRQASLSKSYESLYASNKSGLSRPTNDKTLEAFYPVIDQRQPVLFRTERYLDVTRALTLKKDLNFQITLVDLKDTWPLTSRIKASGAKVFLSLDLPEEIKKDKDKKEDASKAKSAADIEKEGLDKRRAEAIANYAAQPANFQKAGIVFGFSTASAKSKDIPANLRRMIAAGLSEDAALAALTTNPAQLLGLSDRMGTIDNGKMANLVVTDKPYFNEKAKVRHVFVDGMLHKMEVKEVKKSDNGAKAEIEGTWSTAVESPQGKNENKVTFRKDGSGYTGTISGGQMQSAVDLKDVTLDGSALSYWYELNFGGNSFKVEVTATVDGTSFKGTATAGRFGSFPVEGNKDPRN